MVLFVDDHGHWHSTIQFLKCQIESNMFGHCERRAIQSQHTNHKQCVQNV